MGGFNIKTLDSGQFDNIKLDLSSNIKHVTSKCSRNWKFTMKHVDFQLFRSTSNNVKHPKHMALSNGFRSLSTLAWLLGGRGYTPFSDTAISDCDNHIV